VARETSKLTSKSRPVERFTAGGRELIELLLLLLLLLFSAGERDTRGGASNEKAVELLLLLLLLPLLSGGERGTKGASSGEAIKLLAFSAVAAVELLGDEDWSFCLRRVDDLAPGIPVLALRLRNRCGSLETFGSFKRPNSFSLSLFDCMLLATYA
jgi:hypothetical protein